MKLCACLYINKERKRKNRESKSVFGIHFKKISHFEENIFWNVFSIVFIKWV